MGDWDAVFDETYLQTYLPSVDPERTRAEALGAAALTGVEPGAEILDCPTGFGRHAIVLAGRATASPGSTDPRHSLPRRKRDEAMPSGRGSCGATTASFRSRTRASTRSSICSRRSATLSATRMWVCCASSGASSGPAEPSSWKRHTATASPASPNRSRVERGTGSRTAPSTSRNERPTGRQGRSTRTVSSSRPANERIERPYVIHVYSAKEWVEMLHEAGFAEAEAFGRGTASRRSRRTPGG